MSALRRGFPKVTAMAAFILLVETVLFHLVAVLFDDFTATGVISWAVLGIGLGAWVASRVELEEDLLFLLCCVGAGATVLGAAAVLVLYPSPLPMALAIGACFFFPVLYIALVFRRHAADRVYLFEMAGAGLGVIATVALFGLLRSEGILLLIAAATPLLGLLGYLTSPRASRRGRWLATLLVLPLVAGGGTLLGLQVANDTFNVIKVFDRDAPYDEGKIFNTSRPQRLVASYDSLVGRIDVLKAKGQHLVCYNGYANDHFKPFQVKPYEHYRAKGIEWPTGDARVFYGLVDAPRVFVIGSAARGVTKTLKKITPVSNIVPIEINPGILRIMEEDFYEESGRAYEGLEPVHGNALSILRTSDDLYDIITLINTHSGRTIGYRSGPDYLHTAESYELYFDHLDEDGYLLFEERPFNRSGELGLYRMIHTVWNVLAERGAEDPAQHFLMWDWVVSRTLKYPAIDLGTEEPGGVYRHREAYYRGMIVTREPLVGERRERALEWYRDAAHVVRMVYLQDHVEQAEFAQLFDMIEADDFAPLAAEGFDSAPLTNDRPFASLSTRSVPEVSGMVRTSGAVSLGLGLLLLLGTAAGSRRGVALRLSVFNVLVGFGYFLIEILLLQVYQNVFVSPSLSLVLVLGTLLIASGAGGTLAGRLAPWKATALLMPVALLTVQAPSFFLAVGVPGGLAKVLSVVLVAATGLLMGVFFPRGLQRAGEWGLRERIPHLFALNSVAGSFAVVLALFLGIRLGYSSGMVIALGCYVAAALVLAPPQTER